MNKKNIIKVGNIKLVQMSHVVIDLNDFMYEIEKCIKDNTLTKGRLKEITYECLDWYVKAKGGRKPYK